jgi:hypothetical protein
VAERELARWSRFSENLSTSEAAMSSRLPPPRADRKAAIPIGSRQSPT